MATYTLISSVTVGSGGAANIDFTSIPATYTDLCLVASLRNATAVDWFNIRFNTSTSNFTSRMLFNYAGSPVSSSRSDGLEFGLSNNSGFTASTFASSTMYIPNYTSSNNKSISLDTTTENNSSTNYQALQAGLWSNSSAITGITLVPVSGNFAQYSTAYLYGISNA